MQCGWQHRTEGPEYLRSVGETETVAAFTSRFESGKTQACKGIIGFADLRGPHLDDVLWAHRLADEVKAVKLAVGSRVGHIQDSVNTIKPTVITFDQSQQSGQTGGTACAMECPTSRA
jgi:hypothetical protein